MDAPDFHKEFRSVSSALKDLLKLKDEVLKAHKWLDKLLSSLEKKIATLRAREARFKELVESRMRRIEKRPALVRLEVRGQLFDVSREALIRAKDCFLSHMLAYDDWKPSEYNNAFFLDFCHVGFAHVVACVHTPGLPISNLSENEVDSINDAQRFLQLPEVQTGWKCTSATVETPTSSIISNRISCMSLSSDLAYVVTGAFHTTDICIWDLATSQCITQLHCDRPCLAISMSADSNIIVSGHDTGKKDSNTPVYVWYPAAAENNFALFGHTGAVLSVCISSDNSLAFTGSEDRFIRVWDLAARACKLILVGHTGRVDSVFLSADMHWLVSSSHDNRVRVWNIANPQMKFTSEEKFKLEPARGIEAPHWNLVAGEALVLKGHKNNVSAACITPDNTTIVSGGTDKTVRVWSAVTGDCIAVMKGHEGAVCSILLSPDGKVAVSGCKDKTVRVWDLVSFTCIGVITHTFETDLVQYGRSPTAYCLYFDASTIISGGLDTKSLSIKVSKKKGVVYSNVHQSEEES